MANSGYYARNENRIGEGLVENVGRYDAFGRKRVSNPFTIFDSKQIFDNKPLFWDDQEVSGAGTTSAHSPFQASSTLGVASSTAGKRIRQTFLRFDYEPGKSQQVMLSGNLQSSGGGTGITAGMGYIDDDNGIEYFVDQGVPSMRLRSSQSGTPVDIIIPQSQWNVDKMDGLRSSLNPSGITFDPAMGQIFVLDFEWLAMGRARVGFVIDGVIFYVHEFLTANVLPVVYMSTPNLPIRYWIENDGSGVASTMLHTCSTVISEGGSQAVGNTAYHSTNGVSLNTGAAGTTYAVLAIRLKAAQLGCSVELIAVSAISETNDDFEIIIAHNPVVVGTFVFTDKLNSCVQVATGVTANTSSGGFNVGGGLSKSSGQLNINIASSLRLGSNITKTVFDTLVVCVRPLSINAKFQGSLTWRELN